MRTHRTLAALLAPSVALGLALSPAALADIFPPPVGGNLIAGSLNLSGSMVYSPATTQFLRADETVSGAPTSGSPWLNVIDAVDNVDATGIGGALSMLYLDLVPGTSARGQRNALQTQIALNNTTADGVNANFYVAHTVVASAAANQGGIAGTPSANLVGQAIETQLTTGATYFNIVEAAEYGVDVASGVSPAFLNTQKLSANGCGSVTCNGLAFGGIGTNSLRYNMLISLAAQEASGGQPISTTGTLIGAQYPGGTVAQMNAGTGIDLDKFTFSGNAYQSTGFAVSGTGAVTSTSHAVTGTSLPTPAAGTLGIGGVASAPTLAANGEMYLYSLAGYGTTLQGKDSSYDVSLLNSAGTFVAGIPTGSSTFQVQGVQSTPSTSPGTYGSFRVGITTENVGLDMGSTGTTPFAFWMQAKATGGGAHAYPLYLNPNGGVVGVGYAYNATGSGAIFDVNGSINAVGSVTDNGAAPTGTAGSGYVRATGPTVTDEVNKEFEVSTATLTATSNTTLAVVTGLSQSLTAGGNYSCHGHLTGVSGASGGIKVALVATGSLSATSMTFTGLGWSGTTPISNTTVTALGSSIIADTGVYSDLYIDGSILVNAGGTINVEAAQNVSNSTSSTVLIGSTFSCVRVS